MTMRLNTLKPAVGAKTARKRIGRGAGSGTGGTAGRGTKGQKSRSGGYHKVGFEGGQMPLQRRLPKRGFRSTVNKHSAEIRLGELAKVDGEIVDLKSLQKAGVIGLHITRAKAILSGSITRAVTLRGIGVTKGARQAIEQAGGKVEPQVADSKKGVSPAKSSGKKVVAMKKADQPATQKMAEKTAKKASATAPQTDTVKKETSQNTSKAESEKTATSTDEKADPQFQKNGKQTDKPTEEAQS